MKNPFLFLLGCQRSGTTLLQHILDSHPQTAVMQEAGWFGTWYELGLGVSPEGFATQELIPQILRTSKNVDLGVSADELLEMVGTGKQVLYRDFVSKLFDRFGTARGKELAGTKNPDYLRHLPTLRYLWPQAKFIHIIRDGRDVSLCAGDRWKGKESFKGFPFLLYEAPDRVFDNWKEDPVMTTALWWETNVRLGREFGESIGPALYYELQYEHLVSEPERECRGICDFLGLPFDRAMLRHEENFKPRRGAGGSILHARVGLPITSGLREWRTEMPQAEINRFEAVAGPLLEELGYSRGSDRMEPSESAEAGRVRQVFEAVAKPALSESSSVRSQ